MRARVGEERGGGIPLSDVERVMRHYSIDDATARYYLSVHPIEILLPERGYGLTEAIQPPVSGPGPIGQLAEVAVGAYTEIVAIDAPASADAGDLITVMVRVKNLYTAPAYISITGKYDNTVFPFDPGYSSVGAGGSFTAYGQFTMPYKNVRVHIWSFYWTGAEWYQDDYIYRDIALAVPPEVYAGTISKKELEYDSARANIPAYNIPQGERGLVHIWGRNDMTTTQRMGIYWIVRDPDGITVEEHSEWEGWPYTGPGGEHHFIGGRFNLDKPGTYTINIALSMNPDVPEIVDTYYGTLCTVAAAVPEPSFRGFGVREYSTV